MTKDQRQKVTKEEWDAFIAAYPRPLVGNTSAINEPPLYTKNDFSDGKKWPESVVAWIVLNEAMEGHPLYKGEPNDHYIRKGIMP